MVDEAIMCKVEEPSILNDTTPASATTSPGSPVQVAYEISEDVDITPRKARPKASKVRPKVGGKASRVARTSPSVVSLTPRALADSPKEPHFVPATGPAKSN